MSQSLSFVPRFAVYLAPAEPYWRIGNQWLGRCAATDAVLDGQSRPLEWVREPARYGLHATLKAPFRLAGHASPALLDTRARAFATARRPFAAALALRDLRGFLAWCLDDSAANADGIRQMHALADAAVRDFDDLRAPATPAELARRRPDALPDAERRMLERWGYPYVFDTFVFHITLSGQLDPPTMQSARASLRDLCGDLLQTPLRVWGVSLYVQPAEDADFVVARHYGFDGSTVDGAGASFLGARE